MQYIKETQDWSSIKQKEDVARDLSGVGIGARKLCAKPFKNSIWCKQNKNTNKTNKREGKHPHCKRRAFYFPSYIRYAMIVFFVNAVPRTSLGPISQRRWVVFGVRSLHLNACVRVQVAALWDLWKGVWRGSQTNLLRRASAAWRIYMKPWSHLPYVRFCGGLRTHWWLRVGVWYSIRGSGNGSMHPSS